MEACSHWPFRASPSPLALAWLMRRSPVMLPIPGASTVSHLEDSIAGAAIELTDEQFAELNAITGYPGPDIYHAHRP